MDTQIPVFTGFSKSSGGFFHKLLGDTIRIFTKGEVNHAFLVYWDTNWNCWIVMGANANGLTPQSLSQFRLNHDIKHILFPVGFSLWDGMKKHVDDLDKMYNYTGLINMAYVEIHKKITGKYGDNFLSMPDAVFCSEWLSEVIKDSMPVDVFNKWPLANIKVDQIDPSLLCNTELASFFFKEVDLSILDKKWN